MGNSEDPDRWARLRFAVIGPLLAAPPARGELHRKLFDFSTSRWRHPVNCNDIYFSLSTIERWFYAARHAADPMAVLRRCRRSDAGRTRRLTALQIRALEAQYGNHSGWSVQLHVDNLVALAEEDETLKPIPSYSTIRRYLKAQGHYRKRRPKRDTPRQTGRATTGEAGRPFNGHARRR